MDSGDTAQRSLEHSSESGLRQMEEFYVLATEDYRQLALQLTGRRFSVSAPTRDGRSSMSPAAAASSRRPS